MATARDLLDFVTDLFASDAKMENVVRSLQQAGRIPVSGRGRSAHKITIDEAAAILLAYAASLKAVDAARRLGKVEKLRGRVSKRTLLAAFVEALDDNSSIAEMRISRTQSYAVVAYSDGSSEEYHKGTFKLAGRFRIEAVFDAELLTQISAFLVDNDVK